MCYMDRGQAGRWTDRNTTRLIIKTVMVFPVGRTSNPDRRLV